MATSPVCSAAHHRLGVGQAIGQRDFDLNMLARLQAGDRLSGVHLGRRSTG